MKSDKFELFEVESPKMDSESSKRGCWQHPTFKFFLIILVLCIIQIGFAGYGILVKAVAQQANTNPLIFSLIRDAGCFPLLLVCAWIVDVDLHGMIDLFLFHNNYFFFRDLKNRH